MVKIYSILLLILMSVASFATVNYPFPQNVTYPNGYSLTGKSTLALKSDFQTWWSKFYTESGTMARIKFDNPNYTVSEGIGYGMLMAVYMSDNTKSYQAEFDKLWNYYQNFSNSRGLMHWKVNGFSNVDQQNAATDAEMDVAVALIMAYYQFGDSKYKTAALTLLGNMKNYEVDANYVLKPGDAWDDKKNPSYFSYFGIKLFAQFDTQNSTFWNNVASATFSDVLANQSSAGISSDWYSPSNPSNNLGTNMSYDAIRTPWRIALGYYWWGGSEAQTYLSKVATKFASTPASAIKDGIDYISGNITGSYNNSTFVGGIGSAFGVSSSYSSQLSSYYDNVAGQSWDISNSYFSGALNILYRLSMTGNMPNFASMGSSSSSSSVSSSSSSSSVVVSSSSSTSTSTNGVIETFNWHRIDFVGNGVADSNVGYWYSYVDTYGSTIDPGTPADIETNFGDGSLDVSISLASEIASSSQYPYAGVGFDFINNGETTPDASKETIDISSWDGLTVTYSADAPVIVEMAEARTPDGSEYYATLPSTNGSVSTITLNWSDFQQPSWISSAQTRSIPTSAIVGFHFAYKTGDGSVNFSLSKIALAGSGLGHSIEDVEGAETGNPTSSSSSVVSSSSSSSSSVVSSSSSSSSSVVSSSSSSTSTVADGTIETFNWHRIDFVGNGVADSSVGYWYSYVDTYGSTIDPGTPADIETNFGDGSLDVSISLASEIASSSQYPYAGVGFDFINNGETTPDASKETIDISSWDGLTVTYSADAPVIVEMAEARNPDGTEYYATLPATNGSVSTVTLNWSDFQQPSWISSAQTRSIPTSAIVGFHFAYKTGDGSVNFSLSKIALAGSGLGHSIEDVEGAETGNPTSSSSSVVSSSSSSSSSVVSSSSSSSSSVVSSSSSSTSTEADGTIETFNWHRIDFVGDGVADKDVGYWYSYVDTYGSTIDPETPADIEANFGDGSLDVSISLASEIASSSQYPYAGVGFDFINNGETTPDASKETIDISSWDGLTVTYSADAPVIVEMAEARTPDGTEYYATLPATNGSVSTVTLNWSDFQQPSWISSAQSRSIPTSAIVGFHFAYKTGDGSVNFSLSKIALAGSGLGHTIADAEGAENGQAVRKAYVAPGYRFVVAPAPLVGNGVIIAQGNFNSQISFELYNSNGVVIKKLNANGVSTKVNWSDLPKGVYYLVMYDNGKEKGVAVIVKL